jgi:hypothetical protein
MFRWTSQKHWQQSRTSWDNGSDQLHGSTENNQVPSADAQISWSGQTDLKEEQSRASWGCTDQGQMVRSTQSIENNRLHAKKAQKRWKFRLTSWNLQEGSRTSWGCTDRMRKSNLLQRGTITYDLTTRGRNSQSNWMEVSKIITYKLMRGWD